VWLIATRIEDLTPGEIADRSKAAIIRAEPRRRRELRGA
jgi:hypothetical protein